MDPLITTAQYLTYMAQGERTGGSVAAATVFAWGSLARDIARDSGAYRQSSWIYNDEWPHFAIERDKNVPELSIVRMPTGASAAAFVMDQVIECGARSIVVAGFAGALGPHHSPGTTVLVKEALSGEGTSRYYRETKDNSPWPLHAERFAAKPEFIERTAQALRRSGYEFSVGIAWSTDAPLREDKDMIALRRKDGATVVDMETSALYAVAEDKGIEICSLLLVSDVLEDDWTPAVHSQAFRTSYVRYAELLPRLCAELCD